MTSVTPCHTPVATRHGPCSWNTPRVSGVTRILDSMSEEPVTVSADGLASWNDAVHRAEQGDTVAVIAHGTHVADVVPSGELERLRETIEVLSDTELMHDIRDGLADLEAGRVVSAEDVARDLRAPK